MKPKVEIVPVPKCTMPDNFLETVIRSEQFERGNANIIWECLIKEINEFEKRLNEHEEVGAYLASFGKEFLLQIESVTFRNPYMIIFHGKKANSEEKLSLAQHVSQLSVLLCAIKIPSNEKARRIGFNIDK